MGYDALNNDSEADYFKFTEWLEDEAAKDLKQAKGTEFMMRAAIQRYLETGYGAHLSSGELVDFFCVSTPSVLDKAGYSDDEIDFAVKLYDEINYELFPRYYSSPEVVKNTSDEDEPNPPLPIPRNK